MYIPTLKDECPYPDLYWAERPHSIIIDSSQFDQSASDISGLLTLLREQYPQGISVNQRMIKKYNNLSVSKSSRKRRKPQLFIEIGFPDEGARARALETPFLLNGQEIKPTKTLEKSDQNSVYRIQIYDIDKLNNPHRYYSDVLNYLNRYGQVLELHLHYTEGGDWFTGEGCAIWIDKNNVSYEDFEFYKHPKLNFAVNDYKVNN